MKFPSVRAACLALLLAAAPWAARADIWGYVDARGVTHFASEPVDARYTLFFRGGLDFDKAHGEPQPSVGPAPGRVAPERSPRLAAWFESTPGYLQVRPLLQEAARAQGLDYELLKALVAAESGFDARAISPKGAIGLMQVIPATAARFGVREQARLPIARQLADPRTNIAAGTRYLRHLMNLFPGRLDLALAAYNAGEGAVQRAGNRIPNYPETQAYVKTVLQMYGSLRPTALAVAGPPSAPVAVVPGSQRTRVRVELPGALPGVMPGRANMPPSTLAAAPFLSLNTLD